MPVFVMAVEASTEEEIDATGGVIVMPATLLGQALEPLARLALSRLGGPGGRGPRVPAPGHEEDELRQVG